MIYNLSFTGDAKILQRLLSVSSAQLMGPWTSTSCLTHWAACFGDPEQSHNRGSAFQMYKDCFLLRQLPAR